MKHLLNDLSNEEKNRIREQHEGGMKVDTSRFKKLVETKLGDAKPLINESYDFIKKAKDFEKYTVVAGDTLWSITKKLFEKYFTPEELKKSKSYGGPSLDQLISRFINNLVVNINVSVAEGYLKQYGVTKIDNPDSLVTGSILVLPNSKSEILSLLGQDYPHWSKSVNI